MHLSDICHGAPQGFAQLASVLRARGNLVETDSKVGPDLQITGLQKLMGGGCPALFANAKGKPDHQVVTNLLGDIKVVNTMFGRADDKERTHKLARALSKPLRRGETPQAEAPTP